MTCDDCKSRGQCHIENKCREKDKNRFYDESGFVRAHVVTCQYHSKQTSGIKHDSGKPPISDSGNRTEFATGAVRDMHKGKGRMDLLPWTAIMELSKHCENGAIKYGERNVDKTLPMHSLLDSALRHLAKYMEGHKDEDHLLSAFWNIAWAVQFDKNNPEVQNIFLHPFAFNALK